MPTGSLPPSDWTTVAREIPFSFIQFPMYEGLKKFWRAQQARGNALGVV
jgi:hypothetical protein